MEHLVQLTGCVLAAWVVLGCAVAAQELEFEGFPFTIPYGGLAEGTAPEALARLEAPAGAEGFVEVRGDRFVLADSGRPIRFWATNLCFGACFPPHDVAERMARRMASLGINCVRFHHMDASGYPRGIWESQGWGDFEHTGLHPEALDRLDYLIARLKDQGIYVNINLHVSRSYGERDGFPAVGEGERVPNYGKGVDNFYPRCIEEQERYARMLLRHVNAYTGKAYAEEPALAMVEISNEDGLLFEWRGGGLDRLPAPYIEELQRQWNAWLSRKHGSTEALRTAWAEGEVAGDETDLLAAPGVGPALQTIGEAEASVEDSRTADGRAIRTVTVHRASPTSWHVQHTWAPLAVQEGTAYVLRLRMRANREADVSLNCMMNHEPWSRLGLSSGATVTPQWQDYEFYFTATGDDAPDADGSGGARITLSGLSQADLEVQFSNPTLQLASLHGLLPDEGLGTVAWLHKRELAARTPAVGRHLIRFLRDTEVAYWQGMRDYLRDELGVRMPVTGTAVGFTTTHIAAETADFVDSHAYWQHPVFPGRPWDASNWFVRNDVMVNTPDRSTLVGLAARRVFGLPYTVTEYNHPSPHHYEAEGFPLIALYGAFQAWDGIFTFTYASSDRWETDHVSDYFSVASNPVKLAVQPACSAMLLKGGIQPPPRVAAGRSSLEQRLQHVLSGAGWSLDAYPDEVGRLAWQEALVGMALDAKEPAVPEGPGSDLHWDVNDDGRGLVRYVGSGCAGMIGFAEGKTIEVGGISITPGATSLDGFSVIMLNAVDGQALGEPGRYLITAVSRWANRNMGWNEARNSVGRQWGEGPTQCEGVPLMVVTRGNVYPLNPDGSRRALAMHGDGEAGAHYALGPEQRTLWYELVIEG